MSPIDFLSSATGNPIKSRRMIAVQSDLGVPPLDADFVEFYGNGGPLNIQPETVAPELLSTSRDPLQMLEGKLRVGNGPMSLGDADPNSKGLLRLLASICGGYDYSLLASGRSRFIFRPSGAATVAALALLNDNDVIPRTRMMDILPSQLRVEASPGSTLRVTSRLAIGRFDMLGAVTQTAGTGATKPRFMGYLHDHAWAADADAADFKPVIQVVSESARTFKAKKNAAATFGSAVYTWEYDVPVRVYDEDGVPIGSFAEPLLMLVQTGDTHTDLDEFTIDNRRASFGAASIPTRRTIPSVSTQISYAAQGGALAPGRAEGGWSVELTKPEIEVEDDVGGRQASTLLDIGEIACRISVDRRILAPPAGAGLDGQKALLGAEPLVVALQMENK